MLQQQAMSPCHRVLYLSLFQNHPDVTGTGILVAWPSSPGAATHEPGQVELHHLQVIEIETMASLCVDCSQKNPCEPSPRVEMFV